MNSFRIRCTTCRSKLRIKDPSLVGHILSCPKCGSMVQVPDPEGPDPENQLVRESSGSSGGRSRPAKRPADNPPVKLSESDDLFEDAVAMLSESDTPSQEPSKQEPASPKIAPKKVAEPKKTDAQPKSPVAEQPPRHKTPKPTEAPEPLELPARPSKRPQPEVLPGDPSEIDQPKPPQPVRSHRKAAAAAAAAMVPPPEAPQTPPEGSAPDTAKPDGPEPPSPGEPVEPAISGEAPVGEPAPAADIQPVHPQAFAPHAGVGVWRIAAISAGVAAVASVLVVVTLQSFLGGPARETARDVTETEVPGLPRADDAGQLADPTTDDPAGPVDDGTPDDGTPNEDTVAQFEPKEKDPVDPSDRDSGDDDDAGPEAPKTEGLDSDPQTPGETDTAQAPATDQRPAGPEDRNPFLFEPQADVPADEVATADDEVQEEDTRPASMRFRDDPLYDVFGESFPVFDNEMLEATASLPEMLEGDAPLEAAGPEERGEKMLPPVDVEARLADPISQIQYDDVELIRFLRFVSRLTNMPISVSPEALAQADITPSTPVSVKLQNTTVEKMLAATLAPHGLALTKTDRGVRIDLPATLDGQFRTTRLACNDLATNDKELADVAYLLVNLAEPASWKAAGGKGQYRLEGQTIIVNQSESALFSSILLLERLRVARGLSPRSSFAKRLFRLEPRRQQIDPQLQQTITAKFVVPTPLEQLVEHLERQAGVTILCDWESLATDGVSPEALASLSAPQVPLVDALDSLCEELNIRWRPTVGGDIQLIGSQDFDHTPFVEFYSVKNLVQDRPAAAALIKRAEAQLEDLKRHKAGRILYDPKSGHLLARLTQTDHDHLVDFLQNQSR